MKYETNELDAEKSKIFVSYFRSALKNPQHGMIEGDAEAKWDDEKYLLCQFANFEFGGVRLFAQWQLVFDEELRLTSIETLNHIGDESLFYKFVLSIYEKTVAGTTELFFYRDYFRAIVGQPLDGEYWIDGFRFGPAFPDDDCHYINAERFYVIDQTVEAIDAEHAYELARAKADEVSAILSVLLDVGIERPSNEYRYFLEKSTDGQLHMSRQSTQFIDPNFASVMPKKGEICKQLEFEGSVKDSSERYVGQAIRLPKETRKLFRSVRAANDALQDTFSSACGMYQLGLLLGFRRPTVKASYQYGAIDAVIKSNLAKYKGFTPFMTHYANADREWCDLLHGKIRSAHWHAGKLPLGEREHKLDSIYDPLSIPKFTVQRTVSKILRRGLVEWMYETFQLD